MNYILKMELFVQGLTSKLQNLFVGRKRDIENLRDIWGSIKTNKEHLVYVLLNTPGVGKTSLLQHFGELLEQENQGLFLFLQASDNFNTPELINYTLFRTIYEKIRLSQKYIEKYLEMGFKKSDVEYKIKRENLKELLDVVKKNSAKDQISLMDLFNIIKLVSSIIPVFFVTDEIQEFQKVELRLKNSTSNSETETGLHYYTRILKDLLRTPILILLSGTRYHILNQIGEKIGSPIRQKVRSIVLSKFTLDEIQAYIEQIKLLLETTATKFSKAEHEKFAPFLEPLIEMYAQFILGFSGGHPRTIVFITEIFISNLPLIFEQEAYQEYQKFNAFFLPLVEKKIVPIIFTTEIKESLLDMQNNENFGQIKAWLMNGAYTNNQHLGQAPRDLNSPKRSEEMEFMIYNLMNMGIIVQNGQLNYYLTSYFHFLAFLSVFSEPHEQFLRNVLYNPYFQILCGSHGGFGYVFEHILASVLFQLRNENFDSLNIGFKPSQIRAIKSVNIQPDWPSFIPTLESDILYHLPLAQGIDFCIKQNNRLFLLQITTSVTPEKSKIAKLYEIESVILDFVKKSASPTEIHLWFISLYPISLTESPSSNLSITSGDQLVPILGKELYLRLKDVKQNLR